jgi:DNA-binding NtrC family response regulator
MPMETARVLIADDDEGIRFVLEDLLTRLGHTCVCVGNGSEALQTLQKEHFDLALLDICMDGMDGLEVLRSIHGDQPELIVVVVTAHGSPDQALEAIRGGAYDYFTKPFEVPELRITIQRALEKKLMMAQIRELESRIEKQGIFHEIIGESDAMRQVFSLMERVLDNDVPILITGESGTGKERVAEAIHNKGPRAQGPLVKINCAAIPEALLESELFGHEKGSFTGAIQAHAGKFEQANNGTLFLDEIGEMPLSLQAKILRAVQEREVQRVGGKAPIPVDVRLVTATNRNLPAEVAAHRFREDLYFRINVIAIELPPLRERLTDIPLLVNYFIKQYAQRLGKQVKGISQEVMDCFVEYAWPGNIRELENVIQRALIMASSEQIEKSDIPLLLTQEKPLVVPSLPPVPETRKRLVSDKSETVDLSISLPERVDMEVERIERLWIAEALRVYSTRREAARHLGISPRNLDYKIQRYNLS